MRTALIALLLVVPVASAQVAHPEANRSRVVVLVGETVTVRVTAVVDIWMTGGVRFRPWTFSAKNPKYILVEGSIQEPGTSAPMRITGLHPGKTKALFDERFDESRYSVEVTVRCGQEPAIQAAEAQQSVKTGEPVTLRAVTPIAARTTFTWYHGVIGDMSAPIAASGPEIAFTPPAGTHHVWVMAATPCSSSTAQFEVEAWPPRRRTARQ